MDHIFDLAIAFCGAYMIYTAVQLKANGVIRPGIVVPRDINVKSIRDREGLIAYTFPRALLQGVLLVLVGFAGIVFNLMGQGLLHVVTYVAVLVILLVFTMITEKGKRKYY